ncbi:saccharopine dehydrogenase family protein [Prolixibacter sp. SD074]|jgi:saccharopine dehydrogenase (NAD+, L-glutamate forming)|uniref:saccharopine dehydrogenase family protein n=1 Tax=Prolixibacter sp. SD074 TaxID=2652391 RepID=UPI0012768AED|nr:saccharopine dehydrogenase C-terminal domain-containing protein [Prolixibacter sp. SD074]GET28854.1 saccharopine dehydrogenase [Prolixibacter sp. SD074]
MKKVFIIGAGRSSATLIRYMEEQAPTYSWKITVGDQDINLVNDKIAPPTRAIAFNVFDEEQRNLEIEQADIVVSMLPARLHQVVALTCLKFGKSLLTASYVSDELNDLDAEVKAKGLLFLNEMGVDPGIDHMSAMRLIDRVKSEGHAITDFESFTGGLVAPESDNNPWNYKFTWNPRNVVVAGQGGPAKFLQEGKYKYIPYNRLFRRTEVIDIEGFGKFEGYANRDSLKYIDKYNLQGVPTVYRGTLRRPGYCRAWDIFVQLGATDDTYFMENTGNMTYKEFINSFLYYAEAAVRLKLYHYMHIDQDSDIIDKLEYLELFSDKKIGLERATPAQIMEHILSEKWKMEPDDKDMVVMWHKLLYNRNGDSHPVTMTSSMVVLGEDSVHTAMSKTVGLSLAIATKMVMTGQIALTGVHIPNRKEIYGPVLNELESYGIAFVEKEG